MEDHNGKRRPAAAVSKNELVWTNEHLMEDMKAMARRLQALEPLVCTMILRYGTQRITPEELAEASSGKHPIRFVIEDGVLLVQPAELGAAAAVAPATTPAEPKPLVPSQEN